MIITEKIIHRFVKQISMYEEGGKFASQIIPLDTQAWAAYPQDPQNPTAKSGLYYVLGDGQHTYVEIRDGLGSQIYAKEYYAATHQEYLELMLSIDAKQNTLIAGSNIEIVDDVISATGGSSIGLYAFDIENGDLVLEYQDGLTPPKYEINESGELIAEIE